MRSSFPTLFLLYSMPSVLFQIELCISCYRDGDEKKDIILPRLCLQNSINTNMSFCFYDIFFIIYKTYAFQPSAPMVELISLIFFPSSHYLSPVPSYSPIYFCTLMRYFALRKRVRVLVTNKVQRYLHLPVKSYLHTLYC